MTRQGWTHLALEAGLMAVAGRARAQAPAPAVPPAAPAAAADAPPGAPAAEVLSPQIQVVRFQGPAGVRLDVLGPAPEPVPSGDGRGLATVGLRVGVGYRLKLSEIPDYPGVELFPVVEVVGHLHRPPDVDPGKFPIRIVFADEDFVDAVARGRLVTQVVY